MKSYSLSELILVAVVSSLITVFFVVPLSVYYLPLGKQAAFSDFLQNLPFFNQFYQHNNLNLKNTETYTPSGYESQIVNAIKMASPAVVSIVVSKDVPIVEQYYVNPFGNDPFFRQFFGDVQIPQLRQKGFKKEDVGGGSGFVVSSDGLILTNKHVVSDTKAEYTVFTNDGKKYSAKVLARDSIADVAILKIDAPRLSAIKLGNSDEVTVGQTSIVIGNALGEFRNTASVGVISGLSRSITASGGGLTETIYDVIQTDASINPGNSGGPLLNLKGEVVGINTAMVSGAQSIGFAIPINQVKRIISDIINFGKIKTPFLGVRYIAITSSVQDSKKLPFDYGVLVTKGDNNEPAVLPDSPAAKAGLKEGDIILEFGDRKIDLDHPLISRINLYSVGDNIKMKIWRNDLPAQAGKTMNLEVTLAEKS